MTGSTTKDALSDPIVEGGTYEYTHHDGAVITGTIMGTRIDPVTGKKHGNMYLYNTGNVPFEVVENTESMAPFKLKAAPSGKTGKTLAGMHRSKAKAGTEED